MLEDDERALRLLSRQHSVAWLINRALLAAFGCSVLFVAAAPALLRAALEWEGLLGSIAQLVLFLGVLYAAATHDRINTFFRAREAAEDELDSQCYRLRDAIETRIMVSFLRDNPGHRGRIPWAAARQKYLRKEQP
jgi:hypothetical protein